MPMSIKSIMAFGCMTALALPLVACSPRRIPPLGVTDLMDDRVALDGVLLKCNEDPAKAHYEQECVNARIAIERLASRPDPAEEARRQQEFERTREQLRMAQEKLREEQEAKNKVDAYHLPVLPVDPVTSAPPLNNPPPVSNPASANNPPSANPTLR